VLALEIEFLTGRFVATAHHSRTESEWPPHPARVFSALVAAWADADEPDPIERTALEWLEAQSPPSISAGEAVERTAVTHYVRVNDASIVSSPWYERRARDVDAAVRELEEALARTGGDRGAKPVLRASAKLERLRDVSGTVAASDKSSPSGPLHLLPEARVLQARTFPSVTPDSPHVTFTWSAAEPGTGLREALEQLTGRMTRLGHSSSLVSVRVVEDPPPPTFVPDPDGDIVLRTTGRGQLAALQEAFDQHRASRPRSLPFRSARYSRSSSPRVDADIVKPTLAGEWFVFEFAPGSRKLPITQTVAVARALRGALIKHAPNPRDEVLSGHRADSSPTTLPHVAFVPLPFVGHEHADGRIVGCAVLLPGEVTSESRRNILAAIGTWEAEAEAELQLGRGGVVSARRIVGAAPLVSLRRSTWSLPSPSWVSVTPVALPNHPGRLSGSSEAARSRAWARAEELVRLACAHAGLPDPVAVVATPAPLVQGSPPAGRFPSFRQPSRDEGRDVARAQVHVSVTFDQPVRGPVLIGSGRYLGLGLMRPLGGES